MDSQVLLNNILPLNLGIKVGLKSDLAHPKFSAWHTPMLLG